MSLPLALALLAGLAAVALPEMTAQEASAAPSSAAPQAQVWITTPDGSQKMQQHEPVSFRPTSGSDKLTITVDPSLRYQEMDGFGASITGSSAALLSALPVDERDATMRSIFSPTEGIGMSFLRQPIGSSDFVDGPHYSLDDVPAGQTDYPLEHFSIAKDEEQVLPLLRQALQLNPKLKVMATPWSPPAWMKTGGSLIGGRLIDDPSIYDAYARYLVKFVQAYEAAGVPIYGLTIQNEPQNPTPDGYPGTDMPAAQHVKVIERLGPALGDAGLSTLIMGYDHNWALHPGDVESTPGEDPEMEYPTELLNSPAAKWIDGIAFHCYYGDPKRMTELHQAFPKTAIWFTECSGSHNPSDPPEKVFSDTLKWHARNITVGVPRNWSRTTETWNLALDPEGGPHNGGCGTCTGVVTVSADGTVSKNAEYYTIGHLSRFVKPGATRIASSSYGSIGWNGQLIDVAFTNPDGSTALVVHNEYDDPRSFTVAVGDQSFDYTLPGGSLATFTWPASKALATMQLIDPRTTTVTTSENPGEAGLAADDDGATAWSSHTPQQPGQWLQVDLGSNRQVRQLVLDAGPASYGWPNDGSPSSDGPTSYTVQTSRDGQHWTAIGTGAGGGQLTTIPLSGRAERYVRVTLSAASGRWWQVADVRVLR